MLYKLLRCACLHCFHLKMPRKEVDRFRQRLTLLQQVHGSGNTFHCCASSLLNSGRGLRMSCSRRAAAAVCLQFPVHPFWLACLSSS